MKMRNSVFFMVLICWRHKFNVECRFYFIDNPQFSRQLVKALAGLNTNSDASERYQIDQMCQSMIARSRCECGAIRWIPAHNVGSRWLKSRKQRPANVWLILRRKATRGRAGKSENPLRGFSPSPIVAFH